MKLFAALTALICLTQPALASSGYEVIGNQLDSRARIGQIDDARIQLEKQLDRLNDEKKQLDREQSLNGQQLVEILSNVHQIGHCSMDVTSNGQVTTITVQNRKGELATATITNDRMKHADIKVQSRLDGGHAQAIVLAENMKDTANNQSKLMLTIDQNRQIQEMRFMTERPGSDFEAKDCKN